MKKRILQYLKHIAVTVLVITTIFFVVLFYLGNSIKFNRNTNVQSEMLNKEGPFILYSGDSAASIKYILGDEQTGYAVEEAAIEGLPLSLSVHYYVDSSSFTVDIDPKSKFAPESSIYTAQEKILAISDIEGGFGSFRRLLINNKVIDNELNWTFGKGHLVLNGDFIDRGYFVTQVLYLIYRLEQKAERVGGKVHYILGNHEIMNMQGNHHYAVGKYGYTASILGLKQFQLYDDQHTFLGRWLSSKNVVEKIGEHVFTHGGLHPDFATLGLGIDSINRTIRTGYYDHYIPKKGLDKKRTDLLFSSEICPFWYRGYFEDDLTKESIDQLLNFFDCKQIIVGHTIQSHVQKLYDGRIIGIDVQHPQEQWGSYFPAATSEGLLIENGEFFRVDDEGARKKL